MNILETNFVCNYTLVKNYFHTCCPQLFFHSKLSRNNARKLKPTCMKPLQFTPKNNIVLGSPKKFGTSGSLWYNTLSLSPARSLSLLSNPSAKSDLIVFTTNPFESSDGMQC